jgi:hypothetical protein
VHLWTVRGGKAVFLRVFRTKAEALEAAGLRESGARFTSPLRIVCARGNRGAQHPSPSRSGRSDPRQSSVRPVLGASVRHPALGYRLSRSRQGHVESIVGTTARLSFRRVAEQSRRGVDR